MKNITIAITLSLFILSCGSKTHKHDEAGAHTHEDGTTNGHHDADTTQEEFRVDSANHVHDSATHHHSHD